jgi:hypothetical protein
MRVMQRNISFEPCSHDTASFFDYPQPAISAIPEWYSSMDLHLPGESVTGLAPDSVGSSNLTLRGCMPFLDALTAGYMFTLPFDIEIRKNNRGSVGIRWATNVDYIGQHSLDQAPGLPVPPEGSPNILKWRPGWKVTTPVGYSCLFTHPLNHIDLPFITLSGIIDTDVYPLSAEFPFRLLNTSEDLLIIEKGTPIVQIIPFKRDSWKSATKEFNEENIRKGIFALKSKIVRSYQSQFWNRKSYK